MVPLGQGDVEAEVWEPLQRGRRASNCSFAGLKTTMGSLLGGDSPSVEGGIIQNPWWSLSALGHRGAEQPHSPKHQVVANLTQDSPKIRAKIIAILFGGGRKKEAIDVS